MNSEHFWERDPAGKATIPPDLLDHLREIANRHKITDTEVLRKIFTTGLLIIEETDQGEGKFFLRSPDGTEQEVVIFDDTY